MPHSKCRMWVIVSGRLRSIIENYINQRQYAEQNKNAWTTNMLGWSSKAHINKAAQIRRGKKICKLTSTENSALLSLLIYKSSHLELTIDNSQTGAQSSTLIYMSQYQVVSSRDSAKIKPLWFNHGTQVSQMTHLDSNVAGYLRW